MWKADSSTARGRWSSTSQDEIFPANLNVLGRQCGFTLTVTCSEAENGEVIDDQLFRVLFDQDIFADLLWDDRIDRTLKEMVEFIARKEQAMVDCGSKLGV